jgi:nitrate/nitrite-specific signal transduction histidine kinase
LQARLVLAALAPALVILAAVVILTLSAYYRVVESLALERSQALTRLAAQQVALDLSPFVDRLTAATQTSTLAPISPQEQMLALRLAMPDLQVFDGGVVVVDATGRVQAADPRRLELLGEDWSALGFVQAFMQGQPTILGSEAAPIGPQGAPAIAITIITRAQTGAPELVAGLFRLDVPVYSSAFYRLLLRQRNGADRAIYLLDENGRVIGETPAPGYLVALVSQGGLAASGAGAQRLPLGGGVTRVISYAPVPDAAWRLVQDEDWDALAQTGARYGRLLWLLLGLGLALPSLLVGWQARRLMRPLQELTEAAQSMALGELGQRIEPADEWELYQLASSFNQMSAELQELYYGLERKVADRTHELETLNRLATRLGRSLDLRQTLQTTLEQMAQVIRWPAGLAYRATPEGGALELLCSQRVSGHPPQSLPLDAAWGSGAAPVALGEASGGLREVMLAAGWRSVVCVPLAARAGLQGLILLGSPTERALAEEQRALLAAMLRQAAMAADNARLYERAEAEAVAAERNRLARELHDSVSQTLFSANLLAGVIPILWESNPEEARRRQAELRELTQGALAEMRTLLLELRPRALLEAPLEDLLKQLAAAVGGRARLPIALEIPPLPDLPGEVRLTLYRTAQEALNNIAKHAHAQQVWLRLEADTAEAGRAAVRLTVRDDGHGFDPAAVQGDHLGLRMMRERAEAIGGALTIASKPGQGACVTLCWAQAPGGSIEEDAQAEEEQP